MQEITCPNCGEVFQVDESDYQQIAQQVRDKEFAAELQRREAQLQAQRESQLQMLQMKNQQALSDAAARQQAQLTAKDTQIAQLQAQLDRALMEKQLAVREAVEQKDRQLTATRLQIGELQSELKSKATEGQLAAQALQQQYEDKLRLKDEQIEYYKDFKARQSTKMVGESLEQHCETQFNAIRMTAFPQAYFEKDNDARTGSKGDYIFREMSGDTELISIMFEMKNEMETTATKHKNEHFFKELDKDRTEKKCEYAVLVSLLESDSELYNTGIVDVSYKYPKMYVIRPQFFIPMITLLRNAALSSLQYRQQLQVVRNQQIDVSNFEANIAEFKEKFGANFRRASEKFQNAIDEIDKTIQHLQKTKEALLSSENQLRLANNKAEDLTIKRLTKNAPSVRQMFEQAGE